MPDYTVLSPLKTGDGAAQPGDTVTLGAKEAKSLVRLGVIDPTPVKKAANNPAPDDGDPPPS